MARRATLPTPAEHDRLWRAMDTSRRRAVLRHVRRGEAAPSRKEARVAVGIARQQQRFWKWAWALGPAVAVLFSTSETVVLLASAFAGGLGMAVLSAWSHRRAVQSERANLAFLGLDDEA